MPRQAWYVLGAVLHGGGRRDGCSIEMEGRRGVHGISYAALLLGLSLAWGVGTAGIAGADTPQYCRDLAVQFGTDPAQLDANALAALGTCVMSAIQERSSTPSQSAPSEQPQGAAAESPVDNPGWGQWSSPAPWSDDKAKTQSWGDN
jgi:hypothetical protein